MMKFNSLKRLIKARSRSDLHFGNETVFVPSFSFENRGDSEVPHLLIGEKCHIGGAFIVERNNSIITIGDRTYIGGGTTIISANSIQIGSDVLMAWGITIVDHDSHSLNWRDRAEDVERWRVGMNGGGVREAARIKNWEVVPNAPIVISDRVWIGFNSTILKGVTVGRASVIAAGSVVTKDIPSFSVVAGNPARVVRELEQDD